MTLTHEFAGAMDVRGDLLIASPTHLVSTADGESFRGHSVGGFQRLSAPKPVPWR